MVAPNCSPRRPCRYFPSRGLCGPECTAGLSDADAFAFPYRPCRPRAKCTEALAKQSLVMDADDEAVLNLIAECEWDLGRPPGSTSSSQKEREADSLGSQGALLPRQEASGAAGSGMWCHWPWSAQLRFSWDLPLRVGSS